MSEIGREKSLAVLFFREAPPSRKGNEALCPLVVQDSVYKKYDDASLLTLPRP